MEKSLQLIELKKELLDLEAKMEKNGILKIAGFDARLMQSSINIMVGYISAVCGVIVSIIGLDYLIFGIGLIVVSIFCLWIGYANAAEIKGLKEKYILEQKQIEDRILTIKKDLIDIE